MHVDRFDPLGFPRSIVCCDAACFERGRNNPSGLCGCWATARGGPVFKAALEFNPMTTTTQNPTTKERSTDRFYSRGINDHRDAQDAPPCPVPKTDQVSIRDQVHEAFEHVAMGNGCTLPMLLEETQERGIADNDVRHVIQCEEGHGYKR